MLRSGLSGVKPSQALFFPATSALDWQAKSGPYLLLSFVLLKEGVWLSTQKWKLRKAMEYIDHGSLIIHHLVPVCGLFGCTWIEWSEQWCLAASPICLGALYLRFYSLSSQFCMKKPMRNEDPGWLCGVWSICFCWIWIGSCKGGCPEISGVGGTVHWGWSAMVWQSFLRARKTLWRFHLLKDTGLMWYLWEIVSYLDPHPLAFLHLGTAMIFKVLKS